MGKEKRSSEIKQNQVTMKAKIKATGEIVEVEFYTQQFIEMEQENPFCDSCYPIEIYATKDDRKLREDELEFLKEDSQDIDWEQRRYEIAKGAFLRLVGNEKIAITAHERGYSDLQFAVMMAQDATRLADVLIAELNKPIQYGS